MAVLTAEGIAKVAIALLQRVIVLPACVTQVPGTEFSGANGDTVTVRVRVPREARVQETPGAPITFDELAEVGVSLRVRHLYDAARITDEQLSLDIESFADQVTAPQVSSVALAAENQVAEVLNDVVPSLDIAVDGSNIEEMILAAREALTAAGCPLGDRFLVASPAVMSLILLKMATKLVQAGAAGAASALRDATVGMLYGFQVVESGALTAGSAVAFHRSGIVFVTKAPAIPHGAPSAAGVAANGLALRQVFGFDASTLSDASIISTFAGAAAVVDEDESDAVPVRVVGLAITSN